MRASGHPVLGAAHRSDVWAYLDTLAEPFTGLAPDVAEENIQARIRGNLLMALSNKFGWLVLTTGNKSEIAVGYTTLYGDMAGGFAVIKDVPKTLVYELARYRNHRAPGHAHPGVGPRAPCLRQNCARTRPIRTASRPTTSSTASSRPTWCATRVWRRWWPGARTVQRVERMVALIDRNEYKRRQAAPGVRITPKAFGKDRRLPITNRYRG